MYPFVRLTYQMIHAAFRPRIGLFGTHVSRHVCWPWDLDFAWELNNGRTLTLMDTARLPLFVRMGMIGLLRRTGWRPTMAGVVVRYRRRVTVFERLEGRSRLLGWDGRFFYIEQSLWKRDGECASHAVYRVAMLNGRSMMPPARVAEEFDGVQSPPLPDWIEAWSEAEALRPWPPMQDGPK